MPPRKQFQPSLMFEVRPEPSQVEKLSGAPLYSWLLALRTNIAVSWKILTRANFVAYDEHLEITVVKSFVTLDPGWILTKSLEHDFS